ncbi:MAG: hypothetical protein ACRD0P_15335 [Stackebrandtia sp.]
MRTRLLIVFAATAAMFAITTSPALADSAGPAPADQEHAASVATCNYFVWPAEGVNQHERPDRESKIIHHYNQGETINGAPCTNVDGGRYASCGTGNLWKSWGGFWLPTKCLKRV